MKNLASEAFKWGADFIGDIVNGIKSMIGNVGEAVSSVTDKIRSFLHFSVPDEGPLTDYESWMPDFIGGLAKGIEKGRGMIENAMNGVTSDFRYQYGTEYGSCRRRRCGRYRDPGLYRRRDGSGNHAEGCCKRR